MVDVTRAALGRLSASFGLTWLCTTMVAAPGPAAWVALSGSDAQSGAYFATISLSGAFGAILGGFAMDAWGRRAALIAAHVVAALGFSLAGFGYFQGSLVVFAAGTAISSLCVGAIYLTRLAAAEIATPAERARSMARVQVTATAGAVVGPFVLAFVGRDLWLWAIAPFAFILAAMLVAGTQGLRGPAPRASATDAPVEAIPRFRFFAAALALVCAQAAMVTVMGVSGVEMRHVGHAATMIGLMMAMHFVGMFGLSLVVGRLADRFGRARTIGTGLLLVAAGGGTISFVHGPAGLGIGLLLVGLGWSFSYIGSSVLLTDIIPAARRARVMGGVDFTTALLAATGSLLGGIWYAGHGIGGLGLAAAALMALPVIVLLAVKETSAAPAPAPDAA